jgi:Protein of unknown function (DUF2975)
MNPKLKFQNGSLRMNRIKKVIRVVRFLMSASLIIMFSLGAVFLADLLGLHLLPAGVGVSFSPASVFSTPLKIPVVVLILALIRAGLILAGALLLFWWLDLVEAGDFFDGQSVRHLRRLGWLFLIDWLMARLLDALSRKILLDVMEIVIGLLILLIAWIMDEGRKIQEEQELTV